MKVKNFIDKPSIEVEQYCPLCGKASYVEFNGEDAEAVRSYLNGKIRFLQDLPFNAPVREFLKTGYCKNHMEMVFGDTSSQIKERK